MNPNDKPDPRLIEKIHLLDDLPERDSQRASQGRAAFLASAQEMAESAKIAGASAKIPAVSPAPERRHKGWMQTIQSLLMIRRKEQPPMFTALSSLLIILALALGGSGAAVAAAQSSQPDDLLYGLKLTSENMRMEMEGDPADAYQLALAFAERRALEIQTMLQAGGVPPQPVQARYQAQVEQAIQLALNQPDDQAVQALEQIKLRLQTQEQAMQMIHAGGLPDVEAALVRTRAMVQERLQWVEAGLIDPVQLREMLRLRYAGGETNPGAPGLGGVGPGNPWTTGTPLGEPPGSPAPGSGSGSRPGPGTAECPDCTPVQDGHNNQNPWTTGTPVPGSGYGPGPGEGECAECTPVQDGHNSQNPWTTGVPTPGSGYGPGDGECEDCTPGAGPGPQPTPVPPQPTQAGPQPTQYQQPTQAGPQPTQYQQPTQAGPQPTQNAQPTQAGPQPTQGGGGGGGGGGNKP